VKAKVYEVSHALDIPVLLESLLCRRPG
jgi:hypothetical protein